MIVYERPIRFEEVDAAAIVFFARFLNYAHEAMEHFFAGLDGGYSRLIVERKIGLPAVDVKMSFHAPLRYGDVARIETTTARLGKRSAVLRYVFVRAHDGERAAVVEHTVVTSDLTAMRSIDMPADIRAIFEAHLAPA
ncbi:MAG: thioesterase family protein [Polyangiaceae bacterium]